MGTEAPREEGHVEVEAETGARQPQAADHSGPPEAGRDEGGPFAEGAQREHGPVDTLIVDF